MLELDSVLKPVLPRTYIGSFDQHLVLIHARSMDAELASEIVEREAASARGNQNLITLSHVGQNGDLTIEVTPTGGKQGAATQPHEIEHGGNGAPAGRARRSSGHD